MVSSLATAASLIVLASSTAAAAAAPVPAADATRQTLRKAPREIPRVIVDTDLALWWDDVTAFAIVNAAEDQGDARYLGAVSDVKSLDAVPAIDAIDTWYGNGDVPVGATLGTDWDVFPERLQQRARTPVQAFPRRRLPGARGGRGPLPAGARPAARPQRDHRLHRRPPRPSPRCSPRAVASALVERKVKSLVVMAGEFPTAFAGLDQRAHRRAGDGATCSTPPGRRPCRSVWADAKIGFPLLVGPDRDPGAQRAVQVRAAFEILFPDGKVGDANWDAIALYYAIYGLGDGVLSLTGEGGAARVNGGGRHQLGTQPQPARRPLHPGQFVPRG